MPVLVLTSVGADFDARAMAHQLVEARVAACVNIVDRIHSVYRWEGRVTDDAEQLLVIKTTGDRVNALRELLFRLHPYQVPEYVVLHMDETSEAYGNWLRDSVSSGLRQR
jgi:periplasmic divalent cation tolerance protein